MVAYGESFVCHRFAMNDSFSSIVSVDADLALQAIGNSRDNKTMNTERRILACDSFCLDEFNPGLGYRSRLCSPWSGKCSIRLRFCMFFLVIRFLWVRLLRSLSAVAIGGLA